MWHTEDIDEKDAQGAIFRAYVKESEGWSPVDVAYVLIADGTADVSEPDISTLEDADVPALDSALHDAIEKQLPADGMRMVQWMSSQLNETSNLKALLTAYIVEDQGKERQFMAMRTTVRNRKLVVIGVFDVERSEDLAGPMFNALRTMKELPPTH